jgi:hypothetical protein
MGKTKNKSTGSEGEEIAAKYLANLGYRGVDYKEIKKK